MKDYTITEKGPKCLELSFIFNATHKLHAIIGCAGSLTLIVFILIKVTIDSFLEIFMLSGMIVALTSVCLGGYFEWNKNKFKKLLIEEEDLIINDQFYCKVWNIKSIHIVYSTGQHESGWTVYLTRHMNSAEYVIKKRLPQKDAHTIAEKLSFFLGKPVVEDN